MEYENNIPKRIDTILISAQHKNNVDINELRNDIKEKVIKSTIDSKYIDDNTKFYINPTGRFVIGGPLGDTGLTGRKIIVDTYGGHSRHGGGAFSGKDPTKVDRSAAYMARYIAKNIVAAGLARKCEIQISYAIGMSMPVSICVDTFGTSEYTNEVIEGIIERVFDLRPGVIIDTLDLKKTIYANIACYGHMGRSDVNLPWEKTDKVDEIHYEFRSLMGTGIDKI